MGARRRWPVLGVISFLLAAAPSIGSAAAPGEAAGWVRTGGPQGGLGYDVRMAPGHPEVMLVTDAWAGVFRSEDGGATWYPSNDGITARTGLSGDGIPIFSLTIDPHDPSIVWVGTQGIRGIYRSDDGGRTWVEKVRGIVEDEGITFRGFSVDPRSSDVVYAAAEVSSWTWAGEERPGREFDMTRGVVYKTEDGGDHWTAVWRGDNLARYIWIDPTEPDILYVSTGIFDREAANSEPASGVAGGVGVVKSTDGGATWEPANDGLGNLYVGSLYLHPDDPSILLAGTGNNQYHARNGAYLSLDGAGHWQQVIGDDNITAVEFAADPAVAYAASERAIYRSDDGGRTWDTVAGGDESRGWGPPGIRAGFPIDLQVDPGDPDRVFVNNYGGGNFLSTDGGRTWQSASTGYTGALVKAIAVDPTAAGRVYAAVRSGLYVSDDGGADWRGVNFGDSAVLDHHVVAVDPSDPYRLLAATNWTGRFLASGDGGRSWEFVGPDLGEGMAWRCITFAAADPATVYAGSGAYRSAGSFSWEMEAAGVFVSHDGGEQWAAINTGVTERAQISDLAVHPQFIGFVYAASSTDGLLRTYDGGLSWERVAGGLPEGGMALAVAFDPLDPETQLAGYAGLGIFRTTNDGDAWRNAGAGLNPEAIITDIVFDQVRPGVAYVSDLRSGVYRSDDGGATWSRAGEGLRTRAVNALALSSDGRHLYAATEGEGVYRLDLDGSGPEAAAPLWVLSEPEPTPEPIPTTTTRPEAPGTTAPASTATTPAAETPGDDSPGIPWAIIGGGAGGAMALAVAAWWLAGRRRDRP